MFFKVDPSNGVAIYEQLARQVIYAVAGKALREGDLVPSVRELAKQLSVNPNTVARAYQQLQNERIIETVRGTGLAITKEAAAKCGKERVRILRNRVGDVVLEARRSGLAKSDLNEMFDGELETAYAKGSRA
jgi:GntR family transcriptional regulator